jgi:hypothetical protein
MTSRRWIPLIAAMVAVGLASASPVAAQATRPKQAQPKAEPSKQPEVPRNLRPPPGMCRVWVDRVPAGQQPAPTDCANAIRNRPPNGRVIFSDQQSRDARRNKSRQPERREPPKPARKPPGSRPDSSAA